MRLLTSLVSKAKSQFSPAPAPAITTAILRGPRLTAVRRRLLIEAAAWPVQLSKGDLTVSQQVIRRRTAHALDKLGLVHVFKSDGRNSWGSLCPGMLHIRLTAKGRAVVAYYRHEIETGRPIRWARFEGQAMAV